MSDMKLELVAIPVSDVDRAKAFYTGKIGFIADHDQTVSDEMRFVQLTPPGSACSIAIGRGITDAAPGSVAGLQMVVPDIEAAHGDLVKRGAQVSEKHCNFLINLGDATAAHSFERATPSGCQA